MPHILVMLGERSLQSLQIGTGCRYRIQVLLKVGDQRLWSASRVVGDSREHMSASNHGGPGVVSQRFGSTDRQAFSRTGEHRFGVSVALASDVCAADPLSHTDETSRNFLA